MASKELVFAKNLLQIFQCIIQRYGHSVVLMNARLPVDPLNI